ncbi:MAG: hypothetical protein AAB657_03750 [Patescibacteria group bacterium]
MLVKRVGQAYAQRPQHGLTGRSFALRSVQTLRQGGAVLKIGI